MAENGAISQDEIDALLSGKTVEQVQKEEKEQKEAKERKETAAKKAKENIKKRIAESKKLEGKKTESKKTKKTNNKKTNENSSSFEFPEFTNNKPNTKETKKTSEVLSQDEIDRLLKAISSDSESEEKPQTDARRIKIYDFNRPDRFSKEQLRFFSNCCENVCRLLTSEISNQLSTLVHLHVCSVDQLTYEEFIRSIPTPSTLCIANWDVDDCPTKLEQNYFTVTEFDPVISFEILHGNVIDKLNRDLEDMNSESRISADAFKYSSRSSFDLEILKQEIFTKVYQILTNSLNQSGEVARSFAGFIPSKDNTFYTLKTPTVDRLKMEQNPQFATIVAPQEMVALITIEMKIYDEEGMINICLPYPFIRDILLKGNILMTTQSNTNYSFGLQVVPGNSAVSLGEFNVPDGAKLGEGMIIELNKYAGEPVDLVNKETGKVFAKGEVVVIDENFGVRITEVVDKSLEEPKEPDKSKESEAKKSK